VRTHLHFAGQLDARLIIRIGVALGGQSVAAQFDIDAANLGELKRSQTHTKIHARDHDKCSEAEHREARALRTESSMRCNPSDAFALPLTLIALDSVLSSTCCSRVASMSREGGSDGSTNQLSSSPLLAAIS